MNDKYVPKKGDRVRVVLEGEAIYAARDGFALNGADISFKSRDVVSIEKVSPPPPTVDQSVIRVYSAGKPNFGAVLIYDEPAATWRYSDGQKARSPKPTENYEVIFDAGADR